MKRFLSIMALALAASSGNTFAQCSATAFGTSCGPIASGAMYPNGGTIRVDLNVDGAVPRSQVIMVVGLQELSLPMPGYPGCLLQTDWVFHQTHRTDPSGHYSHSRSLPSSATGTIPFSVQFIEVTYDALGNLQLRSSNGVTYRCP